MTGLSIDEVFPNEMFFKIFSFLDLAAFRNVRLVSKKWKRLVVVSHPGIHIVVPITDKTVATISNLTETQVSLYIRRFTEKGNRNEVVSATKGTGLLFANAERIKFRDGKISPVEIQKRLPYAIDTVTSLSFVYLGDDVIMRPFLDMTATFSALRQLEIDTRDTTYGRQPPGFQGMFECYTSILQRLASLDFGPQMPLLESLKLAFNPRSVCFGYTHRFTRQMFVNFLAIAKLILKFKRTLKEVEIDFTGASDAKRNPEELQRLFGIDLMLSQEQLTEMQECTDAFNELVNLNRIRCRAINIRDNPWDWELQLLQRPRNLKELHLVAPRIDGFQYYYFPDLVKLILPENKQMLTSIKIESHRPFDHADLGIFGQSPNLKTLWLEFFHWNRDFNEHKSIESLRLINVDKLPSQMTSLHLKSNRKLDRRRQQVILSREQIRWIVDNLQDLKSFWAQLVVRTTGNQNVGNDNDARQPKDEDEEEWEDEDVTSSNIDVELYRDIMKMPKISDLKFDMLKAGNLSKSKVVRMKEIGEYYEMYKCVSNITATCQTFPSGDYSYDTFACTELSIRID